MNVLNGGVHADNPVDFHMAKYNQLLRIEEELGDQARYAGRDQQQ